MSGGNLKRIKRQSALKAVIDALRDYIIDRNLQPGDRLPSEQELCEGLGVSRNIVREAMRYYRTLGLVDSRPKVGAVIVSLRPENPFAGFLPFLENDPTGEREATEMRMTLECGAAPLMVARCEPADIARFEELLTEFVPGTLVEAEIEFHSHLLKLTGNSLIASLIPLTVEFFSHRRSSADPRRLENIVYDHRMIVEALRKGSAEDLVKALRNHYENQNPQKKQEKR